MKEKQENIKAKFLCLDCRVTLFADTDTKECSRCKSEWLHRIKQGRCFYSREQPNIQIYYCTKRNDYEVALKELEEDRDRNTHYAAQSLRREIAELYNLKER